MPVGRTSFGIGRRGGAWFPSMGMRDLSLRLIG